jgi:caffeoyl-CoA O-methyltransferase
MQAVAEQIEKDIGYVGRFDGTQKIAADISLVEEFRASESSRGKTSTKWSILSERMEGLARELYMVSNSLDPYIKDMSDAEGPAMKAIREKMESTDWADLWESRKTMFSYGTEMSTDPIEAMFLKMLTYMKNPSQVLEVGMFTGYGSMAIAEALPSSGKITSLDIDPFLKEWVQDVTQTMPEGKKHEIIVGPALDSLKGVDFEQKFDLVFIDANKAEYKEYVQILLSRELLAPNAMIVADNVLYNGYPYLSEMYDAQPSRRGFGDAVKEFNAWVRDHPQLEQVILPIRDGVSFIRLKQ